MFFFEGQLFQKRKVIKSDNVLVAWNYVDEEYQWLDLPYLRKTFKKAYTVGQTAKLLRTTPKRINELIKYQMIKPPAYTYDYLNGTYALKTRYFSQEEILNIRQAAWDSLPKNRFGEPYDDRLINEDELIHRIAVDDDREFIYKDDGTVMKIYRA